MFKNSDESFQGKCASAPFKKCFPQAFAIPPRTAKCKYCSITLNCAALFVCCLRTLHAYLSVYLAFIMVALCVTENDHYILRVVFS